MALDFHVPGENPDQNPSGETPPPDADAMLAKFLADAGLTMETATAVKLRFEELGFVPQQHAAEMPHLFDKCFWRMRQCLVITTAPGEPRNVVQHWFIRDKEKHYD